MKMRCKAGLAVIAAALAAVLLAGCASTGIREGLFQGFEYFIDYGSGVYAPMVSITRFSPHRDYPRYKGERPAVITIPGVVGGLPVTRINESAFDSAGFVNVTIPKSVTVIGKNAFRDNWLTSVTIPEGVRIIGEGAFCNNRLLSSVMIPGSVTSIGIDAFSGSKLSSVTIPGSVTTIGEGAFSRNELTSLTILEGVKEISPNAFSNNQLTSITLPESVSFINAYVFNRNPLERVTLTSGLSRDKVAWAAFDSLTPTLLANECRAGVYTKTSSGWFWNNEPIPAYTCLLTDMGIRILKIDRNDPARYDTGVNYFWGNKAYLLPAGEHTIEATYDTRDSEGYGTWSEGSVTFTQRYLFEDTNYIITGDTKEVPGKILFTLKRDEGED